MNVFNVIVLQSAKENSPQEIQAEYKKITALLYGRFYEIFQGAQDIRFQSYTVDEPEEEKMSLPLKLIRSMELIECAGLIYFCNGFTRSVEGRIMFQVSNKDNKLFMYDYSQKMVKCAKDHVCASCGKNIQRGEQALHESGRERFQYINNRYCMDCVTTGKIYLYENV